MCNLSDNLNMPTRGHEVILVIELIICLDLMRKEKQKDHTLSRLVSTPITNILFDKQILYSIHFISDIFYLFMFVRLTEYQIFMGYLMLKFIFSLFFFLLEKYVDVI